MNSPNSTESDPTLLKLFFIPFSTLSHMIPLVDLAMLFSSTATKTTATILTTHFNSLLFQHSIDQHNNKFPNKISIHKLTFPAAEVGLPVGIENFNFITSPEMSTKLYMALSMLQPQIEQFCIYNRPDCIVSDMLFPWTVQLATQLGIPRLLFSPTGFFPLTIIDSLERYKPHSKARSDTEMFVLPGLPDHLEMCRSKLPEFFNKKTFFGDVMKGVLESVEGSYGVVVNSFYELEPAYVEHYRKYNKAKAWTLGPLFLCNDINRDDQGVTKSKNNMRALFHDDQEFNCLNWLDTKELNSVLYICFGSTLLFSNEQLAEIALGLEASDCSFIWVIRSQKEHQNDDDEEEVLKWLPQGLEQKMKIQNKGLIIMGWAPQRLILAHQTIGGFMTHVGWNSLLESLISGVPMITWPLFAEQTLNEKLVIEVLKIGVEVGIENWESMDATLSVEKIVAKKEKIEKAVRRLMGGSIGDCDGNNNNNNIEDDEVKEIRKRAREIGEMGKQAVGESGSSHSYLMSLIQELKLYGKKSSTTLI